MPALFLIWYVGDSERVTVLYFLKNGMLLL